MRSSRRKKSGVFPAKAAKDAGRRQRAPIKLAYDAAVYRRKLIKDLLNEAYRLEKQAEELRVIAENLQEGVSIR